MPACPTSTCTTISLSGALETIDEAKLPNLKNAVATLRKPYSVPHIYSGMVLVYNPNHAQPKAFADLWSDKYRGKVGVVALLRTQIYHGGNARRRR